MAVNTSAWTVKQSGKTLRQTNTHTNQSEDVKINYVEVLSAGLNVYMQV